MKELLENNMANGLEFMAEAFLYCQGKGIPVFLSKNFNEMYIYI